METEERQLEASNLLDFFAQRLSLNILMKINMKN